MANYTVTTNAKQDIGLAAYRADINAERALLGQSALTLAQVADGIFGKVCNARADREAEDKRKRRADAFDAAAPATQASIDATLGVS